VHEAGSAGDSITGTRISPPSSARTRWPASRYGRTRSQLPESAASPARHQRHLGQPAGSGRRAV